MNEQDRQTKLADQSFALHAAIGRFVVEFEQMCFAMSNAVLFALHNAGLQDQQLGNAMLAGLTASPLREMVLSVFAHVYRNDAASVALVRELAARTQTLTTTRNEIIHSTWFIGWASPEDTDFSRAAGMKRKNTKAGPVASSLSHSVKEFDRETANAKQLAVLYNQLLGCLLSGTPPTKYFNRDAHGQIVPGPQPDPVA
jgi:hypothetical protein